VDDEEDWVEPDGDGHGNEVIEVLRDEIVWLREQVASKDQILAGLVEAAALPERTAPKMDPSPAAELYLELLKRCLTRTLYDDDQTIDRTGQIVPRNPRLRAMGRDWPSEAETMIGLQRMDNLQACVTDVLRRGVPGDLIETGVWRGGATIFMRAILCAYDVTDRTVWAADSFAGLPPADPDQYPADVGSVLHKIETLAVGLEEVKANFVRYGLLDDRVRFLAGWFRDTLPEAPIERIAVLRLDGDMYESTMVALRALYPKLSVGGYVIVDDWILHRCRQAVTEFRAEHGIDEEIREIDGSGVYWRRDK
jgi:hypothetical protein